MQPSAACGACRAEVELPDKLWIALVRLAEDLDERLADRDHPIEGERSWAGLPVAYAIWRQAPSCERCGGELEHASVIEGAPHSSACPGCGEPAIDFPVPGTIASAIRVAKQVFVCDPERFVASPTRRTWTLRLRGLTPAQRRRSIEATRTRELESGVRERVTIEDSEDPSIADASNAPRSGKGAKAILRPALVAAALVLALALALAIGL